MSPTPPHAQPLPTPTFTELVGKVREILWTSDEADFVIASVVTVDGKGVDSANSADADADANAFDLDSPLPDLPSTVKGPIGSKPSERLRRGATYRFIGQWVRHDKYGEQFAFSTFTHHLALDRAGIIAYLIAVAPNVGERRAERLWDTFGPAAVETLRNQPGAVFESGIMPLDEAKAAGQALHDEGGMEDVKIALLGLFAGRGFQAGKLIKLALQKWGGKAPEVIRRNPFLLMLARTPDGKRFPSAGFRRCDKLYLDLGGRPDRLKRQMLALWHWMKTAMDGSTWHAVRRVEAALMDALPRTRGDPKRAIALGLRAKWLEKKVDERGGEWLAEAAKAWSEKTVARRVRALGWVPSLPPPSPPIALASGPTPTPCLPSPHTNGTPCVDPWAEL